ncbi:MAG: hypothetical protein NVS3B20_11870 [Polyangiales bacterium]
MSNETKIRNRSAEFDLLPELPPIDDDGDLVSPIGPEHAFSMVGDEPDESEDDATGEDDAPEVWGVTAIFDDGEVIDPSDKNDDSDRTDGPGYGGEDDLVGGDERGLLEGSHDGDGRDSTIAEAGLLSEDELDAFDDGGVEGTGEDPALSIEDSLGPGGEHGFVSLERDSDGSDNFDEGVLEASPLEAEMSGLLTGYSEREPWPPRADVAWVVTQSEHVGDERPSVDNVASPSASKPAYEGLARLGLGRHGVVMSDGSRVVALSPGNALWLSVDAGLHFERVPGCASATAAAIVPSAKADRVMVAALYDASRDYAALVIVRLAKAGGPFAEVVAELTAADGQQSQESLRAVEEDDERGRIESLIVREAESGSLEVVATSAAGTICVRG